MSHWDPAQAQLLLAVQYCFSHWVVLTLKPVPSPNVRLLRLLGQVMEFRGQCDRRAMLVNQILGATRRGTLVRARGMGLRKCIKPRP
jgi:hypothetical protein